MVTNALISGLSRSILSRRPSVSSTGEISFLAIAAVSSVADFAQSRFAGCPGDRFDYVVGFIWHGLDLEPAFGQPFQCPLRYRVSAYRSIATCIQLSLDSFQAPNARGCTRAVAAPRRVPTRLESVQLLHASGEYLDAARKRAPVGHSYRD